MFYIMLVLSLLLILKIFAWKLRLRLLINNTDCIIEGDIMLFGLPVFKRAVHFIFLSIS